MSQVQILPWAPLFYLGTRLRPGKTPSSNDHGLPTVSSYPRHSRTAVPYFCPEGTSMAASPAARHAPPPLPPVGKWRADVTPLRSGLDFPDPIDATTCHGPVDGPRLSGADGWSRLACGPPPANPTTPSPSARARIHRSVPEASSPPSSFRTSSPRNDDGAPRHETATVVPLPKLSVGVTSRSTM